MASIKQAMETANEAHSEAASPAAVKRSASGIVLVPQPPDDPNDPLNWSMAKKILILSIVSLAAFIGIAQALANQFGLFAQAAVYHKTPVEISYSVHSYAASYYRICLHTVILGVCGHRGTCNWPFYLDCPFATNRSKLMYFLGDDRNLGLRYLVGLHDGK